VSWIVPIERVETSLPEGDPSRNRVVYIEHQIIRQKGVRSYRRMPGKDQAYHYRTRDEAEEAQSLCIWYQVRKSSGITWPELRPLPVEEV